MAAADLIIENAKVLTMVDSLPRAESVAIAGNRILTVGKNDEMTPLKAAHTRIIDARGATVTPGIVESHAHIFGGAGELGCLDLAGVHGHDALTAATRSYAAAHPDLRLVYGVLVSYAVLDPLRMPTRHDLDRVLPDRPFAMMTYDHHTVFANTKALEAAGILRGAPVPLGAEIVMGDDGLANGVLVEPGAFRYVMALTPTGGRDFLGFTEAAEPSPTPSTAERAGDRAVLLNGLKHCARYGITSLHNMDGNFYTLELLDEIDNAGDFTLRVQSPFHFKNYFELDRLADASAMAERYRSSRLSSGRVKLFMDGVMESWTAQMLEDYPDKPGVRGEPNFSAAEFNRLAIEIDRRGLQICVHAIGDGAVRQTLNGYAAARAANGARDSRHRIEHIEVIHPDDLPRLRALGVVASLQPTHAPGPVFPAEPASTRLSAATARWAYAWRDIRDAGAIVALNTDWPVAPLDPMVTLHAAVTRRSFPGQPTQSLGVYECLRGQTWGGAYAEHQEHSKGSLAPGLFADLVLWSHDLEVIEPDRIRDTTAQLTICDGRVTHAAAGF